MFKVVTLPFQNFIRSSSLKLTLVALTGLLFFASCSRGITPFEAANGKAKCHRYIK